MFDNDTKEKVYTGVRASNTHETLKPRDIFEASGIQESAVFTAPEQPPISEQIGKFITGMPAETVHQPEGFKRIVPKPSYVPPVLPLTQRVEELEAKIEKLEGQVDGLLERLARFNFKASHKI